MHGYNAERIASVKLQNVNGGVVLPVMKPAVNVDWLPGAACRATYDIECDYQWYRGAVCRAPGPPADIPADIAGDPNDRFTQKVV